MDSHQSNKLNENKRLSFTNIDNGFIENEDKYLSNEVVLLAGTYVGEAQIGRHIELKDVKSLRYYQLYFNRHSEIVVICVVIFHILLALFEEPAVTGLHLSWKITMSLELLILAFYIMRVVLLRLFMDNSSFLSDLKCQIIVSLLTLCLLDMVIYVALIASGKNALRWSRCLRPLFIVNFPEMRQIRRSFRNLRRTLPDVMNVLVLLFFSLCIFSLMAYKLFGSMNLSMANGRPYFDTYWNSLFDLYVLITTANNPDIMMPAFDLNIWYVLFFVVFLLLCFFIYMNIILAVIYTNFRKNLKNEMKSSVINKKRQLCRAFDLICEQRNRREVITKETFMQLMDALPQRRSTSVHEILWVVLDSEGTNVIGKNDFLRVADLLNIEVREVTDETTFFSKKFPAVFNSGVSMIVRKMVNKKAFRYTFDLLTVVNAFCIGLSDSLSDWSDDALEWIFLSVFMIEIILKLYAIGVRKFFFRLWNVFDFVVIGSAFLLGLIEEASQGVKESRVALDALLVLRVLRLVKVIGSIQRFKVIMDTINKILPSLLNYGSVIMIIYYMFAIVGMEMFSGLVSGEQGEKWCGNPRLNGTEFWSERYCKNNFNDIVHAYIVMFELTVVNQWQVIAYGFAAVTNPFARLYFMTFHVVCVVVVLNIFTAFVLEVFILEFSSSGGKLESEVEKRIQELGLSTKCPMAPQTNVKCEEALVVDTDSSDDEGEAPSVTERKFSCVTRFQNMNVRFRISRNVKSVEVLLRKLFENEITEEIDQAQEFNSSGSVP